MRKEIDMSPEPFVTADEIAAHLKTTRRQVLDMARKGLIPAHPICHGSRRKMWRFKVGEVDQVIASGGRRPVCEGPHGQKTTSDTIMQAVPVARRENSHG